MRIAIAGLGHVGGATLDLLRSQAALLEGRAGQALDVVAVCARDRGKPRGLDLSGMAWVDDPVALADLADVVVEAIGGREGAARAVVETALAQGKHVVSANKALIAAHGVALASLAEKAGVRLAFEASVCGAVPVLKVLREGLAANAVTSVRGILNGTCNYILSRMESDALDFEAALAEAQALGYAEADPSDDIDGVDTVNKLAILSAVAFGVAPELDSLFVEGIRSITPEDLRDAASRGGRIKLLGIAEKTAHADGARIVQRVQPVFVPYDEPLASVGGVLNAVQILGDCAGESFIMGRGAGAPTASAIVADLVDIARGGRSYAFGIPAARLG